MHKSFVSRDYHRKQFQAHNILTSPYGTFIQPFACSSAVSECVRVLFHCIYSSKRQSSNILIMNEIDTSRVNLYLTFSIETLMTPKGISCCLTWKQKKKICNAPKRLNPICFIPISTAGVSTQIFVWMKFNYFINLLFYHCVIDAWDHELGQKVSVFTFNGKCIIVKPLDLRSLRYVFLLAFLVLTVHSIQYAL